MAAELGEHAQVAHLLASAVAPQPPLMLSDGGVIASDYDAELDELRRLSTNADHFLIDLGAARAREQRHRHAEGWLQPRPRLLHRDQQEPGGQGAAALQRAARRLTNAERYITEELKSFEDKVLSARDRALSRENELYEALLDELGERLAALASAAPATRRARCAGRLRRARARAELAAPQLLDTRRACEIARGRHPVVEPCANDPFVPNDLDVAAHPITGRAC